MCDPIVLVTNITSPTALIIGFAMGWAYSSWYHRRKHKTFIEITHPKCISCSNNLTCSRCSKIEVERKNVVG